MNKPPLLLALLLLCPLSWAAPAAAQNALDAAQAQALFDTGLAEMKAKLYDKGCPILAQSQLLDPQPGTLFTLAVCQERRGHIATAVTLYDEYLALYQRLPTAQQVQQSSRPQVAKENRDKLAPEVPLLTLSLPPDAPAGTVVKRDGKAVAATALGVALPVNPGDHEITTEAPRGPVWELSITLAKGDKQIVSLEVRPPPAPAKTGPSERRVAAYVTGGVGIAALTLGGVLGGIALAQKGTIKQHCGSAIEDAHPINCDSTGLDAVSTGKTMAAASTVGLIIGAVGVGTGVVLLLTEPKQPATGTRAPRIAAGLLSAGPAGAMLGAQGAW
jgi:hypothetical protein